MLRRFAILTVASLVVLPLVASAGSIAPSGRGTIGQRSNSNEIRLFASAGTIAYYSNGKFKSVYRERTTDTTVRQVFKFEVEAFPPNAEVPVSLNGEFVAMVIVNAAGGGEFQFASIDNNPGDEQPLPGGFPRLRAGDTITIGPLTSVFN